VSWNAVQDQESSLVISSPVDKSGLASRWPLALIAGVAAGAVCWLSYRLPPPSTSDLDQLIVAARALLAGGDPYRSVAESQHYPLFYPLPAVLVVAPLAFLGTEFARAGWAVISAFAFALAAARYRRGLAVGMLSANFLNAIVLNQWSPLLTAAAVFPLLGTLWIAKPSVGAAMAVAFPTRRGALGGAVLLSISLVVLPVWPTEWLAALHHSGRAAPLFRPGGVVLLLALLRWRWPEARMLIGLACVPQTIGLYETLPLFLIPRTRGEAYVLAGLSYVAAFGQVAVFPRTPGMSLEQNLADRWPFVLGLLYLPALALLFRTPRTPSVTSEPE
jgi:hypothetical protein